MEICIVKKYNISCAYNYAYIFHKKSLTRIQNILLEELQPALLVLGCYYVAWISRELVYAIANGKAVLKKKSFKVWITKKMIQTLGISILQHLANLSQLL